MWGGGGEPEKISQTRNETGNSTQTLKKGHAQLSLRSGRGKMWKGVRWERAVEKNGGKMIKMGPRHSLFTKRGLGANKHFSV